MNSLDYTIISLIFLVSLRQYIIVVGGDGFSLELIHRDSIDPPGNITDDERLRRLVRFSEPPLDRSNTTSQGLDIRPVVTEERLMYLVKLRIGGKHFLLGLDTGSDLVWTQSDPCKSCFPHDNPNYNPRESSTFKGLESGHHLCVELYHGCKYDKTYDSGKIYTRGVLGTEAFSFASRDNPGVKIIPLVFGSSNDNSATFFGNRRMVSGLFGMGYHDVSFIMQVRYRVRGRFSFCLVPTSAQGINSYLRFGDDVVMDDWYQTTRLLRRAGSVWYYVKLEGISVNGERLGLPRGIFEPQGNHGGCMIDTGSPLMYMVSPAFNAIKRSLKRYFSRFDGIVPLPAGQGVLEVCYSMPANLDIALPPIALHFEGARLELSGRKMFSVSRAKSYFCLMMRRSEKITMVGALSLENIHMVFDIRERRVYFANKDCANL